MSRRSYRSHAVGWAQQATAIDWSKDLEAGLADAKAKQKILMICVNAKFVDGKKTEERANKGLREVVYKDPSVVAKSREFICALFTPGSSKSEFGELRLIGIEGAIVSPQHIFVHPDGKTILVRQQYWSHGKGEPAVKALLALMVKAEKKLAGEADEPPAGPEAPGAPSGDGRPAWIQARLAEVVSGSGKVRRRTIDLLIRSDKGGDCTTPLALLMQEHKKNSILLVDLIRGLGRDKLIDAGEPIAAFLTHKEQTVRGNAAVSLEYIGCRDKGVVTALLRAAAKEKDVGIANHMYRALGRCGVENKKVRSLLLKKSGGSKSEFASYGATLGLAYFKGDKKAARGMEKIIQKIGIPGGKRGGGTNTVKRGVVCWTLANIGDPKSSTFVKEELIDKLKNIKAFWVEPLAGFYRNVARACNDATKIPEIEGGVRGFVSYAKGANLGRYGAETRSLMDICRKGREAAEFKPKGDNLLGDAGDS